MLNKSEYGQLNERVEIGTVIDVCPRSRENLKNIKEELMGLVASSKEKIRFDYEFITKEGKARFMLWGNNELIEQMINTINETA